MVEDEDERNARLLGKLKRRFTNREKNFLEAAYSANPKWNDIRMQTLAIQLGCKRLKVYKWHYDRKTRVQRVERQTESQPES